MTILEFIFLVMSIPLASLYLSTILILRFALLIILNIVIYYHIIDGTILSVLSTSLNILGGLFQPTLLSQSSLILMSSFFSIFKMNEPYILLSLIPLVYTNAETDKPKVLKDNKGRAGIYQWTHNKSGKIYLGSAFDLSLRLKQYYSIPRLNRNKNQYFSRALLFHGHSSFSLRILEYIIIENLSKEKARLLILEREQYHLDLIFKGTEPNTYNILITAGSSLGNSHSPEVRAKIRKGLSDPFIRAKMREAKLGPNNHNFNKEFSLETRAKMSASIRKAMSDPTLRAKLSKAHLGAKNSNFGKVPSAETLAKMSAAQGSTIFLYDTNGSLVNTFSSMRMAGKFINCSPTTIKKYALTQQLIQGKWILSFSAKE